VPDENGPKYVGLADPFPKVVRERGAEVCQRPRGGKRNALNCEESEDAVGIDSSSNDPPESHARGSEGTPSGLEGLWQVERAGGLLPPMVGVLKRIEGAQGETRIGSLIGWTFSVEPRGEGFAMMYRPPFSAFVDEVRAGPGDSWVGSSLLDGRKFGRFRMRRIEGHRHSQASEEENMVDQERLRQKLADYVEYVHALEQNVLLQLDSLILNTRDQELSAMFRHHKEETRRQQKRLRERRVALGRRMGLSAASKDLAAIAVAQVKGVGDVLRADKAVQNARDAFVTEHTVIAAYELLERLAERAGDPETVRVARESRAEEEAMAARISENWDRFLDLTLREQGLLPHSS
jgi:ferritin-like metal-binding protein YciE